jgi:endonuclease YncB( thermonuclease family)
MHRRPSTRVRSTGPLPALLFAITAIFAVTAARGLPEARGQPEPGQTFTGRVVEVTDGDTYDVRRSAGGTVTVRLHGVDTPESSQPHGRAATRAARRYIGGENVRVTVEDIGRYGRTVGAVEAGGADLGALLIRGGHAWYYERYAPEKTEYARLQRQARNAERGLWARPSPTPPWDWRDRTSGPGETSTEDKDCSDFSTYSEALRFFRAHQPGDPHNLDGNSDGEPCESLPGGP